MKKARNRINNNPLGKKLTINVIIIFLLVNCPGAFAKTERATNGNKIKQVTLQLKWKHQFQFAGYYAAKEKGYYKELGIDVNLVEAESNQNPSDAVFEGKAEFGIADSDVLLMRTQQKNAVVLASIFQHSAQILLASKQSGIENVHNLIGKRIALEAHATDIIAYLNNEGVSLDKCILDRHNFNIDALLDKQVDAITAYSSDEPFLLLKTNFEYTIISPLMGGIDFYGDVLFTTQELINSDLQLVEDFRLASLRGWKYACKNKEEIIDLIYDKYSKRHSKEHLEFEAEHMKSLILGDVVEIGYSNPGRWESILNIYKNKKIISPSFTTEGLLYSDYIKPTTRIPWKVLAVFSLAFIIIGSATYYYYYSSKRLEDEIRNRLAIQKELEESEELYRSILKASPDDITVTDLDGRITMVSAMAVKMFGYNNKEEMLDRPINDFLASKDRNRATENFALRLRDITIGPNVYCRQRKDGSVFDIEVNSEFIRNSMGDPIQVVLIVRDISQRIQVEEALIESENRLARAEKIAKIGNWKLLLNTGQIVSSVGARIIYGVNQNQLSLDDVQKIPLPEYREMLNKALDDLINNDIPYNLEFKIKRPNDGAIIDIRSIADYDKENKIIFGVVHNITDQKLVDERINKLLAEKEIILREVHHRIKNNMNTVKSLLELQAETSNEPSIIAAFQDAENRIQSMSVLYDKLYRSDNFNEISMKEYLTSLIDEIIQVFPNKKEIIIKKDINDCIITVQKVLPVGIIINELLTNIMKYAFSGRQDGLIVITVNKINDKIKISLMDNGIGLPEAINFDSSKGFGMQLVSMLTEQIDGNIYIERNNGTNFILEFTI